MTLTAFFLIISSAFFHALWNAIAKKNKMTLAFYAAICIASASLWIQVQFWTPVDVLSLPMKYWIFVISSVIGDLIFYGWGLSLAYKSMDMSSAYPMMRSLPLIFIALATSLFGWGGKLGAGAICGIIIVIAGCIMMPLERFSDFKIGDYLSPKMFFILMVAIGTTNYTICDSQAQKVLANAVAEQNISKPVISMTFYSCRCILLSSTALAVTLLLKNERQVWCEFIRERNWRPFIAGIIASLTYITVLIAMNFVTNVTYVQLFRQVGLIFGVAFGIIALKERCAIPKIFGVALIITGLVLTVIKF